MSAPEIASGRGCNNHAVWQRQKNEVMAAWANVTGDAEWNEYERQGNALDALLATEATSLPAFLVQVSIVLEMAEEMYNKPDLFGAVRAFISKHGGPQA